MTIDWNNTMIIGSCAVESEEQFIKLAEELSELRKQVRKWCWSEFDIVMKGSYSKANRRDGKAFRGLSLEEAIPIYERVKREFGFKIISDVHTVEEIKQVGNILDVIQIPHSLSRYSSIIEAAARTGKPIVIKKGLFVSVPDILLSAEKIRAAGNAQPILIVERGTQVGSKEVIVDMRNFNKIVFEDMCWSVIGQLYTAIDASHPAESRAYVRPLALSGAASGASTLFLETHCDPDNALCDGVHMLKPSSLLDLIMDFRKVQVSIE